MSKFKKSLRQVLGSKGSITLPTENGFIDIEKYIESFVDEFAELSAKYKLDLLTEKEGDRLRDLNAEIQFTQNNSRAYPSRGTIRNLLEKKTREYVDKIKKSQP